MEKKGPRNLDEAFRSLRVIGTLLGLRMPEYPRGQRRSNLGWTYAWIVALLCAYMMFCFLDKETVDTTRQRAFGHIFTALAVRVGIAMVVVYTFGGMYYSETFDDCLREITEVDETLESLGSPTNYRGEQAWATFTVSCWMLHTVALSILTGRWVRLNYVYLSSAICVTLIYIASLNTSICMDLTLSLVVRSVESRFVRMNKIILAITTNGREQSGPKAGKGPIVVLPAFDDEYNDARGTTNVGRVQHVLRVTKSTQLRLRRICDRLSAIFGTQVSLETATTILVVTSIIYEMYLGYVAHDESTEMMTVRIVALTSTIATYFLKTAVVCIVCDRTHVEAKRTCTVIHKIVDTVVDRDTKDSIEQFALQMELFPVKFTAAGYCCIDCGMLHNVVVVVMTYVIILIQMSGSP